ncbi:MAG: hypothetical protein IVW57_03505, partial [Ktedonobacterales bacterium]|nr:hypothetical protein [Ktedonobacterales bacterium]
VAVPLLVLWAVIYPLINIIHSLDTNQFWVQCAQKTNVPGSCTFTQFTGYIICAIVFTNLFAVLIAGLYFWSTRRNTVILGATIAIIYLGLAATIIHTDDPVQLPLGLVLATGILVMAFIFTWATQREFAPTVPQQLGCLGQWLVLGTLLIIFLFGYAFFSLPKFFELESGLAFFYQGGAGVLHDAFWVALLMGGLALLQMVLLIRRQHAPMGMLRRFAFTALIVATVLFIASAIMGTHNDVLSGGVDALEGGSAVAVAGLCVGLGGVLISLYGAVRAHGMASAWPAVIVASALIGIAEAYIAYVLPGAWPDLVIFGFILAMAGAFAYTVAGPDAPIYDEVYANGGGALAEQGGGGFVITRP